MNEQKWKNKSWILNEPYPKETKLYISIIVSLSIILFIIIFCYHFPIYKTFYGYVQENYKKEVRIIVPISEIEDFEEALLKNDNIKLISIENEFDNVSRNNIIYANVLVTIDEKLLIKNNIVPIRLKIKKINLWQEFRKKWKEGMKK